MQDALIDGAARVVGLYDGDRLVGFCRAATDQVACCLHGRAEAVAAFHRKFREGVLSQPEWRALLEQFENECDAGAFRWLPLSAMVVARLSKVA